MEVVFNFNAHHNNVFLIEAWRTAAICQGFNTGQVEAVIDEAKSEKRMSGIISVLANHSTNVISLCQAELEVYIHDEDSIFYAEKVEREDPRPEPDRKGFSSVAQVSSMLR